MNIKNNVINQLPFLLVSLVILGMFTNDTQGILNISAVLLLLTTIYILIKNKKNIKDDVFTLLKNRKTFFLFNVWCLTSILFFTYSNFTLAALKEFFNDWRYVIIISLFLFAFKSNESKLTKTISYALIATLAFTIFISPILKQFKGSDLPLFLQLRYGFAHYITLLFPFTFSALFVLKNKLLKCIMLLLSILAFTFLVYTGSRGGVLSLTIESIIILFIFSKNIKTFGLYLILFFIISLGITALAYTNIPQVKNKLDQTLYAKNITSSRDKIVSTRFPIFTNSTEKFIFGIGYGSVSYDQYLNDNNAPTGIGVYSEKKKIYVYNNDEPFFLNIIYNIGIGGLMLFSLAFFINMKDVYKDIKKEKNILNVGMLVSSIGYFLIYCLFEFIFLDIFFLYNILTVILINKVLRK